MKITALVENTSKTELKAAHGLSLYIETRKHRILFDLGPDGTLFENAEKLGLDLTEVDTVILSHGHMDHGGALAAFLERNKTAKVYAQRSAFEPHYNKLFFFRVPIGLDRALAADPRVVLLDGDDRIDGELSLFTVRGPGRCLSSANDVLYDEKGRDAFAHEQHLIVTEDQTALIMGCGHAGVVNILEKAKAYGPKLSVGGYHLMNPVFCKAESPALLDEIAQDLRAYTDTRFYTCHCTGPKAFRYLSDRLPNLSYLSCGESLEG